MTHKYKKLVLIKKKLLKISRELITHLKSKNIKVYLITGGFSCLIEPVAKAVGIPMENVFANKLLFFYNGDYAGKIFFIIWFKTFINK